MYKADTVTDTRWFRSNGTLSEDPEFNAAVVAAVVRGFQGEHGLERDGVAHERDVTPADAGSWTRHPSLVPLP